MFPRTKKEPQGDLYRFLWALTTKTLEVIQPELEENWINFSEDRGEPELTTARALDFVNEILAERRTAAIAAAKGETNGTP